MINFKNISFILTLSGLLLATSESWADSVNLRDILYRCDSLYCPGRSGINIKAEAQQRLDFELTETRPQAVNIDARVISSESDLLSAEQEAEVERAAEEVEIAERTDTSVFENGGGGTTTPSRSGAGDSETASAIPNNHDGHRNVNEGSGGGGGFSSPNSNQQQNAGNFSNQTAQSIDVGNNNIKAGGLLYNDEEVEGAEVSKIEASKGQMADRINPVDLNNQRSADKNQIAAIDNADQKKKQALAGGSGSSPSSSNTNIGQTTSDEFQGAGGRSKKSSSSLLGKIASSLGLDKFFGASGGKDGPGANRMQAQANLKDKAQRLNKKMKIASNQNPDFYKNMLKDQYGRSPASSPEYGSAKSFIYGTLCGSYHKYAKENGIPNDIAECPKN